VYSPRAPTSSSTVISIGQGMAIGRASTSSVWTTAGGLWSIGTCCSAYRRPRRIQTRCFDSHWRDATCALAGGRCRDVDATSRLAVGKRQEPLPELNRVSETDRVGCGRNPSRGRFGAVAASHHEPHDMRFPGFQLFTWTHAASGGPEPRVVERPNAASASLCTTVQP